MIPQDPLAQLPAEVVSTSFDLLLIALGIAILVVVVAIHGAGIRRISRSFAGRWVHVTTDTPRWRVELLFASVIAQLVIVHLVEAMIWALPLYWLNLIPDFSAATFFAAEAYTTLGEGAVRLPMSWRQLGPIIAVSGLFTFGWTSSVLVYVMTQFGTLDTRHAERKKAAETDAA
ncbi:two pore domain potassium channel family protein [Bosea sp. BK604]|uniref:two pore domain potassium channel family protein n=1 Tax=Bosea sp. BK604 TaxID=2512180 RepID=UPI0010E1EF09|nr:two pore domain potassium channel family protein [Bosea sp. BK604]TCR62953.1 hypothetical protein EV560_10946 [Bosea sp. BK604]